MLSIEVEYLLGRVLATRTDERDAAEWPPHPQRLFSALLASAASLGLPAAALDALRWLESLPPPELKVSMQMGARQVHKHFVPVNDEAIKDDKQKIDPRHPLDRRNRQERFFPAVNPDDPVVVFQWSRADVDAANAHRAALARMLHVLSYLGHSASPVRAQLLDAPASTNLRPDPDGEYLLRVPGPGRLERLLALHASGQTDLPPGRFQRYTDAADATPQTCFSPDALVLRIASGPRLGLDSTIALTQLLRAALIKRIGVPQPAALSGHDDDQRPSSEPHLAIVPLPFIDAAHADGTVKGFALVPPRGLGSRLRQTLELAIDGRWPLHLGALGSLSLERVETHDPDLLRSLRFEQACKVSAMWASATPVVLDRHPKRKGPTAEQVIAGSCERIGLPPPVEIRLGAVGALTAVPRAGDFHGDATQVSGRMRQHILLRFATPVRGPIMLGAGRFIGLGWCLPWRQRSPGEAQG